jgi:arylsulfatase A-like enzyme
MHERPSFDDRTRLQLRRNRGSLHLSPLSRSLCPASFLALLLALIAWACSGADPSRPNIVFILADDLGWHDVGYHGSEIQTPVIDRMAAEGARLESFYALPVCTPSRASLLTGRYAMRTGLQADVVRPWSRRGLPRDERTLAQALREDGYQTWMAGKWHLGQNDKELLPMQRGFDHHYGSYCGLIDYYTHERLGGLDWHRDGKALVEKGHTTDLIANEAVRILTEHSGGKPLFLYVSFSAPHAPLEPPPECLGLYPEIASKERRLYAMQVTCLDRAIGRILAAIDASAAAKNTLVVFASDNGGDTKFGSENAPLRGGKGDLYDGGVRVPAIVRWPGRVAPAVVNEVVHMVDWYPTLLGLTHASLDQPLPLDGFDMWPTITEGKPSPHAEILINIEPELAALRSGSWKIVVAGRLPTPTSEDKEVKRIELYDLQHDPSEEHDLSAQEPERVKVLLERLCEYSRQAAPFEGGPLDAKPPGYQPPKVWGD